MHHALFDPARLLREAAAAIHPEALGKDISVNIFCAEGLSSVWGDYSKLSQTLGVLCNNAVKFTPEGGMTRLSAEQRADQTLALSVADTGIGIAPAYQERVFTKFFQVDSSKTRRYEGAGIGLSVAKSIVEAHGGKIELVSEPGKGATFTVVLPGTVFETHEAIELPESCRGLPVVMVTALDDMDAKIKGIESGADDFLTKPPKKVELLARTKSLLNIKKLNDNLTSIEFVLFSMANAVEEKDHYTQGHVKRVSNMAMSLGRKMGLNETDLRALKIGGALHDIGKIGVPNKILNKPGPLNHEEMAIMQKHPESGYQICLPLKNNLGPALDIIQQHHEKLDGSGYPNGLTEKDISLVARIMAVADIYDALVTDRPYRKAMPIEKAVSILQQEANDKKLDKDVVQHLLGIINTSNETVLD